MENVILIRFGELFLKGKNRGVFERRLLTNINIKLAKFDVVAVKIGFRYLVAGYDVNLENTIIQELKTVFGIHSLSPAIMVESKEQAILDHLSTIKISKDTFRVTVNRADKTFPHNSTSFSALAGGVVLKNNPHLKVDLHSAQLELYIDIRENNKTFVFYDMIDAERGIPLGMGGRGLLLLSGGIDSPVAGYMIGKRGMELEAIHFHSYPYTSEQAKEKVITLANSLSRYTGEIKLHFIKFTKIQEAIHKNCDSEYMITIMRRIMLKIAEKVAAKNSLDAIISGESLGQVASQTIESIAVTNDAVQAIPVLRPLIAIDKEDIINISKKINTYSTSILPYEDCCTVFLPKHPVIKPKLKKAEREESRLDLESLINEALNDIETILINNI